MNFPNAFYEVFLRYNQEDIKKIILALAENEPGFVIHCFAGRDRTGVVIALLLDLLKETTIITEKHIIEDYLNTGHNTQKEAMNIFLLTLKELGGTRKYLMDNGLREDTINQVVDKFIDLKS